MNCMVSGSQAKSGIAVKTGHITFKLLLIIPALNMGTIESAYFGQSFIVIPLDLFSISFSG